MTHAFQWYAWLEAVNKRPDITPSTVRVAAIQLARRATTRPATATPAGAASGELQRQQARGDVRDRESAAAL